MALQNILTRTRYRLQDPPKETALINTYSLDI